MKVLTTNITFFLYSVNIKNVPKPIGNTKVLIEKWAKEPFRI